MKLRLTPRAFRDLQDISDYIRTRNPYAAARVSAAILASFRILLLFPEIGRRQSTAGVRKLVVRRYPYLVYYHVDAEANEVFILTVQHPARDSDYENA